MCNNLFSQYKATAETTDLIDIIRNGKVKGQYPKEIRSFEITHLHFYSSRAYEYVRTVYKDKLPSVRTIPFVSGTKVLMERMYIRGISCIENEDKMYIRQEVRHNIAQKKYYGYVNFGNPFQNEDDDRESAKEVLVFLVNATDDRFKIPIAYYILFKRTKRIREK